MTWPLVLTYVGVSVGASLVLYLGLAGGMYWATYVRRRADAAAWKCQPERWLSPAMNRHAIALGTLNMALGSTISGAIACHVFHGGKSALYFDLKTHGLAFTLASIALVFVVTDLAAYWAHRLYHRPGAFKHVHKWHHRYGAPTPFTTTAMHPVEFLTYQTIFIVPAFVVPMHVAAYYGLLLYVFYYNVCDHSGIKHRALVPWQPPSQFHDDHHKYFHCNFGQSSLWWDGLWGTLRRVGRRYGEDVFGGKGAPGSSAPSARAEAVFVDYRRGGTGAP
jgi:lathosterol oxidase